MMWAWRKELLKLAGFIIIAGVLSVFIGAVIFLPLLIVILAATLIHQMLLITQLERWLSRGAGGEIPKGSGIWEDIYYHFYRLRSAKKKRKKELSKMIKQFRQSTDVLPDAAVVLGKNDEIEWSNKLAHHVLGLKKKDRGQRLPNLIRLPEFADFLQQHQDSDSLTITSPIDPQQILQLRIVKYGIGQRLLIAHDITQQKKMELMRKNFVANVSHELRTPLTVLKGYLETLQEMGYSNAELLNNSLVQMSGQTERMQYLVDDLLLLARLETQQQKKEYIEVPDLLQEICTTIESMIGYPRIELNLKTNAGLYGDEEELRSAFSNLIENALKYSPTESQVTVNWQQLGKELSFEVIDQGEGIAENNISRVTERFYRVDVKRSRKLSGTGLGLAIVKHVLKRHHAQLKISSQLGKGSCFCCLFSSPEK